MSALVLALVLLLASGTEAFAGPLIVSLLFSAAFAASAAGIILGAVITLAISFGLSYVASKLLAKKGEESAADGVQLDLRVDADIPQSLIVGRAVLAGSLVYAGTYGKRGDIDNSDMVEIIALADHPCQGLVAAYIEGTLAVLQAAAGDRGQIVDEYSEKLALKFYDGTQTEADVLAVAALNTGGVVDMGGSLGSQALFGSAGGSATNQPWTAAHVGTGITYVRTHSIYDRELVPGRMRWKFVVDGIKLYDPRKDTTVGGSGAHRWGTEATYEWTDNVAVIVYNIVRGIYVGGEIFYGIEGTTADQLPLDIWFAAMNECDVLIALDAGGTEKQFRAGGEIPISSEPLEVVKELLKSCGGRFVEIGGTYKLYMGAPGLAVLSFNDEHIAANRPETFKPILALERRINYITGSYIAPADGWIPKIAPPRGNSEWRTEDGRRLPADLAVAMVQSGTQMQRLQEQALRRSRQQRKHTATLGPGAFVVEPGDVVEWNSDRNGYVNKLFEVDGVDYEGNLNVTLSLTEVDPADYDWDTDLELPEADGLLVTTQPSPKVIVGFDAEGTTDQGDDGTRRPAIRLSWDDPEEDDVIAVQWQLRKAAVPADVASGRSDEPDAGEAIIVGGFQPITEYEIRARFESFNGYATNWSLWISATTPNVRFDLQDFDISTSAYLTTFLAATRLELKATIDRIALIVARRDAATFDERKEILRELSMQNESSSAKFSEIITVIATVDLALAQRITTLSAAVADWVRAEITETQTAFATADEALAQTIATHTAQIADANAAIEETNTAYVAADTALAQIDTTLAASIASEAATRAAAISATNTAFANADTALAQTDTTLAASIASEAATRAAAITSVQTAYAAADAALASSITTLTASFNNYTAGIKARFVVGATPAGATAMYELLLNVNDAVAGQQIVLMPNGTSFMRLDATRVEIGRSDLGGFHPFFTFDTAAGRVVINIPGGAIGPDTLTTLELMSNALVAPFYKVLGAQTTYLVDGPSISVGTLTDLDIESDSAGGMFDIDVLIQFDPVPLVVGDPNLTFQLYVDDDMISSARIQRLVKGDASANPGTTPFIPFYQYVPSMVLSDAVFLDPGEYTIRVDVVGPVNSGLSINTLKTVIKATQLKKTNAVTN